MTSILVFIATCIAVVAGIGYFVYKFGPLIASLFNNAFVAFESIQALIPDWLLPYIGVILLICVVGLLVKLL